MKTVIAATDFSPASLSAVNYAADLAVLVNAGLLLVNVYNIPVIYNDGPIISVPVEELRQRSETDLDSIKSGIGRRTGWKMKITTKSRMGNVTEELEDVCKSIQPFVIVIGMRGKTNFEKTVFGSSALSIIQHLNWPVLCIPPGFGYGRGIRKIGFACDFKEVTETIPAPAIKQFIKEFNAELHILNVDYKEKQFRSGTPEESFSLHRMFQEEKPHYHYINNPDIRDGINDFAKDNRLDMIITVPKKHKLLEKFFKPSTTGKIIAKSQVPVMCIHQ